MRIQSPSSGFWGRFEEMLHLCGPPSWKYLMTTSSDIATAKQHLNDASTEEQLAARRLLAAVTHPDTQQPIFLPFRMAAHVPVNTALLIGMLTAQSPLATGLWQFLNQSFNAAQFFANRNASNDVDTRSILASYAGAVASSVSVAVLLRNLTAARHTHLSTLTPFIAAVAAKPFQIGLMRQDEWRHGINVREADGKVVGTSVTAGQKAVSMTVLVRSVYLAPMIYIPYLYEYLRRISPLLQRSRFAAGATYVAITAASSAFVTPACMAIFDQQSRIKTSELEADIRANTSEQWLYFNKGL